jgi:hypothetical protein
MLRTLDPVTEIAPGSRPSRFVRHSKLLNARVAQDQSAEIARTRDKPVKRVQLAGLHKFSISQSGSSS